MENISTLDKGVISTYLSQLPDKALNLGVRILLVLFFLFIGIQFIKIIRKIVKKSLLRVNADLGVVQFLDSFIKVVLLTLLFFMIATKCGLEASSVVAVLGSAGVAIGLALQGSLSNFAGGVLILVLRPFRVGDYIIEDTKKNEGTVKEISIFYTKLITGDEKIIVLPNGTLANTSLTNVTATPNRRLEFKVFITYQSNLQNAKDIAEKILETEELTVKTEPMTVYVDSLDNGCINLGISCMVLNGDFLLAKRSLMEKIKISFDENQIELCSAQMGVKIRP